MYVINKLIDMMHNAWLLSYAFIKTYPRNSLKSETDIYRTAKRIKLENPGCSGCSGLQNPGYSRKFKKH